MVYEIQARAVARGISRGMRWADPRSEPSVAKPSERSMAVPTAPACGSGGYGGHAAGERGQWASAVDYALDTKVALPGRALTNPAT